MNAILDAFERMSLPEAAGWMLVENLALFGLAVVLGDLLVRRFAGRPVGPGPEPLERREVALAGGCILLNTGVTLAGWWLWRAGLIVIRRDVGPRAWLDVPVLVLAMDLAMYASHRLAHHPLIFPIVHRTHHRYQNPRPIDLFVLNPLEVLGFGALWLGVLVLYASSWLGIVVFLTLNLLFGMVGHLGVEPLPDSWARRRLFRHVGTSTFHAGHHHDARHNFGFYTLIWDRLFGTIDPGYTESFGRQASGDRPR